MLKGDKMKDRNEVERIYEKLDELVAMYAELNKKRKLGIQLIKKEVVDLNKIVTNLRYLTYTYKRAMELKDSQEKLSSYIDPSKHIIGSDGWVIDSILLEPDVPTIDKEAVLGKEIKILDITTYPSDFPGIQTFYGKSLIEYSGKQFMLTLSPQIYKRIRDIGVLPIIAVLNKKKSEKTGFEYYLIEKHNVLPDSHPIKIPELL